MSSVNSKLSARLRALADMIDANKIETGFEDYQIKEVNVENVSLVLTSSKTPTWYVTIPELLKEIKV